MSEETIKTYVAQVPSNIAFIKYWGKRDESQQWPSGDSLSMTLDTACTITTARLHDGAKDLLELNGRLLWPNEPRSEKPLAHIERLRGLLGYKARLELTSRNTFPSDCGIASSASGLGALTLAAIAAWTAAANLEELEGLGFSRVRLASLARLGSGSACRSFHAGFVTWHSGVSPAEQTLETVATPPDFELADVIVVLSTEPKSVSSTTAHRAAWASPLFRPRLAGLAAKLTATRAALARGALDELGPLIETETIEMHAVIMTGEPPVRFLGEPTSQLLTWVRERRAAGEFPAYFTVDAGPNVHLICLQKDAAAVAALVKESFSDYTVLIDRQGQGPKLHVESRRPEALRKAAKDV